MSISFLRIDDRMIHGQTVTRWSVEYPCDGLIAVNDRAANTQALKMAYKSASTKKTFVWTYDAWKKKCQKVLDSNDQYSNAFMVPTCTPSVPEIQMIAASATLNAS